MWQLHWCVLAASWQYVGNCTIAWLQRAQKKRSRRHPAKTITDADNAYDIAILANTPNQAETLLHSLEWAATGIGLHVNAHKTEYMCYNQTGDITTLDRTPLKLVDKFTYLGSSFSSTEKDIDTRLTKAWTAIDRLSIIWKSDMTDKMKRSFFQAVVVSILLYGCTTWTLTKWLEKKLDGNYTRMLRAILNKSWRQHPTRHQLYGHLPPITPTIQVRRTRHAGHCWRSRDELINDVLLWTPTYGRAKAGRPARTYIQQLCEDTGCGPENLPEAMNDWEKWRKRVRDICACGMREWWYICQDSGVGSDCGRGDLHNVIFNSSDIRYVFVSIFIITRGPTIFTLLSQSPSYHYHSWWGQWEDNFPPNSTVFLIFPLMTSDRRLLPLCPNMLDCQFDRASSKTQWTEGQPFVPD